MSGVSEVVDNFAKPRNPWGERGERGERGCFSQGRRRVACARYVWRAHQAGLHLMNCTPLTSLTSLSSLKSLIRNWKF
jgi:hypothetical protein